MWIFSRFLQKAPSLFTVCQKNNCYRNTTLPSGLGQTTVQNENSIFVQCNLKNIILVFKITVCCVSLFYAMISLTVMFMCKSRSAFLSSSFFKIAISFLSSAFNFSPFITYLRRSKIDQVKILCGSFLK